MHFKFLFQETQWRNDLSLLQSISWMVESTGIEPVTSCLQGRRSPSWANPPYKDCLKWWAKMDSNHRPHDYQSCALASWAIGPYLASTSSLGTSSSVPSKLNNASIHKLFTLVLTLGRYHNTLCSSYGSLLRKEVIQPHLPIRLPCYEFTPITGPTFGRALLAVRLRTSGVPDSHGVTGGVYKARERIHRGMLIHDY